MTVALGKYIRFDGGEYVVVGMVTNGETFEKMILYHPVGDDGGIWVYPASKWSKPIEHNGQMIKQFRFVDETISESFTCAPLELQGPQKSQESKGQPAGLTKHSSSAEKIELFMSLFTGRDDVYAKRWENAKRETAGYVPDCYNEWGPLCPKSGGGKMKCGDCSVHAFKSFDAATIEKHLTGRLTVGAYAMLPDETCRFLAFDFDAKEYTSEDLLRDIAAIREVCVEKSINMAIERSRSGKGIHFWIFFSEAIPASVARKFGSSLITYAMNKHHTLTLKTYDRLIPSQDTLPKGGFGNLIALPLQKYPRERGNSSFIDDKLVVYNDQWNYLSGIKKYTLEEIESLTRQLSSIGELGELRRDVEAEVEKPWEGKKQERKLTRLDFPETVRVVRANMLYIEKAGISSPALNKLKRLAAFSNPEFYKAQAMRMSTHNKPRIISCFEETEQYMCLPRGLENELIDILEENGVKTVLCKETNNGREIDVVFNGELRDEQQQASDALLAHDNGILSATTAFGKTVIGAHLIASRKVNTLILVHRTNLLSQWIERLNEFLIINEEPIAEFTPKGRRRKKNVIGQIGGGTNNLSGIIDVAVMQSLVSDDEVKSVVKNYGMVIVDECHHVSAFSFEQILKAVNAKYVYGLTATPTRQDGHHPIIYMHCGKIRYRVDAKKQAETRPFNHFVIPRFTRFQRPPHQDENKWTLPYIYNYMQNNEARNELIVHDVIVAVGQGRNPIILSERTDHVKCLAEMLRPYVKNVIALIGGTSQKMKRETLQSVVGVPENESLVLVATGKYMGEGFDLPRLDTLFLAMPISWKGTLQQYVGRLHRLYVSKREVQVYDYVDVHVAMLEKMYHKRLKGYAGIGYKAKGDAQPVDDTHCIFDNTTFCPIYSADVMAARSEVIIVSPFLTKRRIWAALNYLSATSAKVMVITKSSDNYSEKDRAKIAECIDLLTRRNITVKIKDRLRQKFAVIDQRVVWYGSINLLSYGLSEESIMRLDSTEIAGELLMSI